jgi:hypothetical protein
MKLAGGDDESKSDERPEKWRTCSSGGLFLVPTVSAV